MEVNIEMDHMGDTCTSVDLTRKRKKETNTRFSTEIIISNPTNPVLWCLSMKEEVTGNVQYMADGCYRVKPQKQTKVGVDF